MSFGGSVVRWFGGRVLLQKAKTFINRSAVSLRSAEHFQKSPRIVAASKVFVVKSELFIKASICAVVPVDGARELVLSVFAVNSDNWVGWGLEFNLIVVDHHSDDARPEGLQVVPPS
jgi:hypothetical protein